MSDLSTRIRAFNTAGWPLLIEAADEIDRLRAQLAASSVPTVSDLVRKTQPLYNHLSPAETQILDELIEALQSADERVHYAEGTAELAVKHRNEAEAQRASARTALQRIAALVESEDGEPLDDAIAIANRALTDDKRGE